MKHILIKALLLSTLMMLTACPQESGVELNTQIYLTNVSDQEVEVILLADLANSSSDSMVSIGLINSIYQDINSPKVIGSNDTILFRKFNLEALTNNDYDARYYFVFNADTLRKLSPEEVQRTHRGVTKYYLRTLADYEAIDFTLKYPKP